MGKWKLSFLSKITARMLNLTIFALAIGVYISLILSSVIRQSPPYDYWLITRGAEGFCSQSSADRFQYGAAQDNYYPAPLYASLCLPLRIAPRLLHILWLLIPLLVVIWLSRDKAVLLLFLPFADHMLLGQSTWLVLPLYILAAQDRKNPPRWYGLLLPLAIIKPHIAFAAVMYLAYRWHKHLYVLLVAVLATILFCIPAFIIHPTWLSEWLTNGRGLAESLGYTSLAYLPFRSGVRSMVVVILVCLIGGLAVYGMLRWRRGQLVFYDWLLLFCLSNPLLLSYDLIILLPFIVRQKRRLWLATAICVWTWIVSLSMMHPDRDFNPFGINLIIPLVLLLERLWNGSGRQEPVAQYDVRTTSRPIEHSIV